MEKRFQIIILILFACILGIQAKSRETLYLKNGTILQGYIKKQILGESITFHIEQADITVDSRWLAKQTEEEVDTSAIDILWKKWYKANHQQKPSSSITMTKIQIADKSTIQRYIKNNKEDSLTMAFITRYYKEEDAVQVRVLEDGSDVRFIDLTQRDFTFNISDIRSIAYSERDPLAINGIIDVIETNSGKIYKGTIIESIIGKSYRMKTTNGVIQSISIDDISKIKKERLNTHLSITKQTPALDVIDDIQGIITLQYFGKDQSEDYLIITDTNDKGHKFSSKSVYDIKRIDNSSYEPLTDIVINNHETYFNQTIVYPLSLEKNKQGRYILSNEQTKNIKTINVDAVKKELIVTMENKEDDEAYMLFPIKQNKNGRDSKFSFSAEEMIKFIPYKNKLVSVANNLQLTYKLEKGTYAFYKNNEFYFFTIK